MYFLEEDLVILNVILFLDFAYHLDLLGRDEIREVELLDQRGGWVEPLHHKSVLPLRHVSYTNL